MIVEDGHVIEQSSLYDDVPSSGMFRRELKDAAKVDDNDPLFEHVEETMPFFMEGRRCSKIRYTSFYGLQTHPNRLPEDAGDNSNFFIWCNAVFNQDRGGMDSIGQLSRLPKRSPKSPYVIGTSRLLLDYCSMDFDEQCQAWYDIFTTRNDILYVNMDRGVSRTCDDEYGQLPGIVEAPPTKLDFEPPVVGDGQEFLQRKYLLFFAGLNHEGWFASSMARPWLFRSYKEWKNPTDDVLISQSLHNIQYINSLRGTRFSLIPHGDGRWNNRLADVIHAGAIPVFLADGLEPPYSPLIHWEDASIHFKEEMALDMEGMLQELRAIPPERVVELASNVQKIREVCFGTYAKRMDCFLKTVTLVVKNQTFAEPPKEFAERLRVPLCPRKEQYDDSGEVKYENTTYSSFHTLY